MFCLLINHLLLFHSYRFFFFFNATATTEIYTLSLHDALPISELLATIVLGNTVANAAIVALALSSVLHGSASMARSEEHTSELQSHSDLVCRLLLEKKKKNKDSTRG